ncbi:hypothetical protein ACIA74_13825 [Streptomyces sp. NPDC051658]|uniref:hypothetical protein n=1 Tax=Streptomyces sp. NPDC051658 TaxID=3365667 RepID=UPI0037AD9BA0
MTDRIPLDDLTSDQLDALYDRVAELEQQQLANADAAADHTDRTCEAVAARDQAVAATERVRAVLATRDWPHAEVRAADIRAALDRQQPTT